MLTTMAHRPNLLSQPDTPTPQRAIVLYATGSGSRDASEHATIHEIKNGKMQAGRLTDLANVRRTITRQANLSQRQPKNVNAESLIVPDNVLVNKSDLLVWHTPKQKREMWFSQNKQNALMVWWPSLVFAVNPGSTIGGLMIFAKATNQRPSANTKLYHAPLMNISGGLLCQGGAKVPNKRDFTTLAKMENTLFDSYFTHSNYGEDSKRDYYLDNRAHVRFWQNKEKHDAKVRAKEMHYAISFCEFLSRFKGASN